MQQNPMASLFNEFHSKPLKSKQDKRYGKLMAEGFLSQIKGEANSTSYFSDRNKRIDARRKFASGQQDMTEFLDFIGIDAKNAFVNLDVDSPSIAPKYIRRMIERFMERNERPTVNAVDDMSKKAKVRKKDEAEFRMRKGAEIDELSQMGGINLEDPEEYVPDDADDLDMWSEMELRLPQEIKFEKGILNVLNDNDIEVIKQKCLRDIAIDGFSLLFPYLDSNKRIKVRWVEPKSAFYTSFTYDDARDCVVVGELEKMKVSSFRKMYPDVKEQTLFEWAKKSDQKPGITFTWSATWIDSIARPYDDVLIEVFRFRMKSVETEINIKKTSATGKIKVVKVDELPTNLGENKEVIYTNQEVVYAGTYVVPAKEMVEWGIAKNMIKPHFALHEVFLDYVLVMPEVDSNMQNVSIAQSMIPNIRRMMVLELKIQQLIAKLKADGVAINPKRLGEVDLGLGKQTPLEVAAIWEQTGVLYYEDIHEWALHTFHNLA